MAVLQETFPVTGFSPIYFFTQRTFSSLQGYCLAKPLSSNPYSPAKAGGN
jgi:hypothetical protein